MLHIPVLLQEVLPFLDPKPNENFIDATLGEGGHAKAILEKTPPNGVVLGIDRDIEQIERAKKELSKFRKRVIYVNDSFSNLLSIVKEYGKGLAWQGILFDLGWSSAQLEGSGRGFSFLRDEPLDMRYRVKSQITNSKSQINLNDQNRKSKTLTARRIVNTWREKEIERILKEYGEERFARRITKTIGEQKKVKPIITTFQLVDAIKRATPRWYHHRKIHFATKTFQALRIAVNNEFEEVEKGVRAGLEVISKKGKIVVISFHSGEGRIVKNLFREFQRSGYGTILTKKPILPSSKEWDLNPRARSARLRVFQKFS